MKLSPPKSEHSGSVRHICPSSSELISSRVADDALEISEASEPVNVVLVPCSRNPRPKLMISEIKFREIYSFEFSKTRPLVKLESSQW